jgi:hypothetical protein
MRLSSSFIINYASYVAPLLVLLQNRANGNGTPKCSWLLRHYAKDSHIAST